MRAAIIGGTGFDTIEGIHLEPEIIHTAYGDVKVYRGGGEWEDIFFLPRHGISHSTPPHRINYRANIKALHQLGVTHVLATLAVGSISAHLPPGSLVAVDQFLDFTQNREGTFFNGGQEGFAHTLMSYPYCPALRQRMIEIGAKLGVSIVPKGTYVCTNGPRLETAAEIRMFSILGGDVVGMTGVPEAPLARELGLHYAALAYSINWAAGIEAGKEITFIEEGLEALKKSVLTVFLQTLRSSDFPSCECESSRLMFHPPEEERA
ncbi:S-methyl-5'-thioinosine phosphorylase [Thermanaerothrix sp. 4228-RoL]|uniref:Probable S-methyl-5'-thioinosine phosphorylase n=1 Tax=Thermanaerothrix solaris TaxID=3058434 RepID=A0ABU3NMR5_9CHLR|nr:S-methyl-5'-thioinosine phosphorylase [Thermanaerothrix sp. 4228-RoL]MDT8898148.1 S-methyl-5'-thioinosine phosphorylase [Thermanaerothrix sp. 4228-RoL]